MVKKRQQTCTSVGTSSLSCLNLCKRSDESFRAAKSFSAKGKDLVSAGATLTTALHFTIAFFLAALFTTLSNSVKLRLPLGNSVFTLQAAGSCALEDEEEDPCLAGAKRLLVC